MKTSDLLKEMRELRKPEHLFIRWWRKEQDFLDYDLLERFIDEQTAGQEIHGFELLTMEQMWDALLRYSSGRVSKTSRDGAELLVWRRKDGIDQELPLTPDNVMEVFDAETDDTVID